MCCSLMQMTTAFHMDLVWGKNHEMAVPEIILWGKMTGFLEPITTDIYKICTILDVTLPLTKILRLLKMLLICSQSAFHTGEQYNEMPSLLQVLLMV
jgi:hypothetical protein